MSAEPTRRLFFALWPDAAQRTALVRATARAVRHGGGRAVPEASLHVTLAFLGAVPGSRAGLLGALAARAAAAVATDALPLTLRFATLEHWARPQTLVALAREAPGSGGAVAMLAGALVTAAAAAGFGPDLKPFRAHVTVARKVLRPPRELAIHEVVWSFGELALLESRTLQSGPVYSVVASHLLGGVENMRT
ncbi:MAG TPA: RNA 2',3'-cyclic phosphodiesterase [Steroidobacteraceae bacterium]|nr:RNA 2',3'-cyclic phosphodiesterase [Gammaproteobacteria bacterium]HEV2286150.1 RNA 2',3'-cyclic phosphodiesterase [Steroidobacteraceae bacterium]